MQHVMISTTSPHVSTKHSTCYCLSVEAGRIAPFCPIVSGFLLSSFPGSTDSTTSHSQGVYRGLDKQKQ
eukprot:12444-Eustigmatos_ZCMA.PRE.1